MCTGPAYFSITRHLFRLSGPAMSSGVCGQIVGTLKEMLAAILHEHIGEQIPATTLVAPSIERTVSSRSDGFICATYTSLPRNSLLDNLWINIQERNLCRTQSAIRPCFGHELPTSSSPGPLPPYNACCDMLACTPFLTLSSHTPSQFH